MKTTPMQTIRNNDAASALHEAALQPYERGSIIIPSLLLLTAVGGVTAGTMAVMQSNTEGSQEETYMMQGTSVADSYLALIESLPPDQRQSRARPVAQDLKNVIYDGDGGARITEPDPQEPGNWRSGIVEVGGKDYGYQVSIGGESEVASSENPYAGAGPLKPDPNSQTNICNGQKNNSSPNHINVICTWEGTDDQSYSEPIYFLTTDAIKTITVKFVFKDDAAVRFNSIIVGGAEQKSEFFIKSTGNSSFRFTGDVIVTSDTGGSSGTGGSSDGDGPSDGDGLGAGVSLDIDMDDSSSTGDSGEGVFEGDVIVDGSRSGDHNFRIRAKDEGVRLRFEENLIISDPSTKGDPTKVQVRFGREWIKGSPSISNICNSDPNGVAPGTNLHVGGRFIIDGHKPHSNLDFFHSATGWFQDPIYILGDKSDTDIDLKLDSQVMFAGGIGVEDAKHFDLKFKEKSGGPPRAFFPPKHCIRKDIGGADKVPLIPNDTLNAYDSYVAPLINAEKQAIQTVKSGGEGIKRRWK